MSVASSGSLSPGGRTALPILADEAARQLRVCNACRYCEGLCAVFPALERRTDLSAGDLTQLANLCHDCRACYDACMYTAPHEFALNLPKALTEVRLTDYQGLVWPSRVPRLLSGWAGLVSGALIATLLMFGIAIANAGWSGVIAGTGAARSPYALVPYGVLVALMAAAMGYAFAVFTIAGCRYWHATRRSGQRVTAAVIGSSIVEAVTMRYLRGGGGDCYYPRDDEPSPRRRRLHALVAGGFTLCVASTVTAGILQDIAGIRPPYRWLSVPVLTGTAGGIGLLIGCCGLIALKAKSSGLTGVQAMTVKDYGLLVGLAFLALSGLATLLTRSTAAFGPVLLVHLAAVLLSFASAPYSKFVHLVFRFAALVRDNAERAAR